MRIPSVVLSGYIFSLIYTYLPKTKTLILMGLPYVARNIHWTPFGACRTPPITIRHTPCEETRLVGSGEQFGASEELGLWCRRCRRRCFE